MIIYAVDDEKYPLELLEESITEAIPGAQPVCFRAAEELLAAAKITPPDIVFLDIKMPGMSGIEVAEKLNEMNSSVKIIFCTGYSEYAGQAFDVYASGYLMKPCSAAQIRKLMLKMVRPITQTKDITVQAFGNFDVAYKGVPVQFRSPKSKELLAYLVDRNGTYVSRQEAAAVLFEDDYSRKVQTRLSQIATALSEDLKAVGITNFFFSEKGFHVDMSQAICDVTEYLSGNPQYTYCGEYMEQYSWSEFRKGVFEERKR